MAQMLMLHQEDPVETLKAKVEGLLPGVELFFGNILVAIYQRPERMASGLYLSDATRDEDKYQGKVGLVLMKGPTAFKDEGEVKFYGQDVDVGDWVVFRPSDGWPWSLGKTECRLLRDVDVKAKIRAPDWVW